MTEPATLAAELGRRQHEAEDALVHGDVGPRLAMWSHREPVTLFAALGPSKRGWAELEPMFRAVASRVSNGRDVSYELIAFDTAGDIAWTVGVSRFTVSIDRGPPSRRTLRLTHLYRREAGEWKVVHEHSDFQPPDHETPTPVTS
jgi:ketosteroid isomerase-like protein